MPAILAFLAKIFVGPFAKVAQIVLSFILDKVWAGIVKAIDDFKKKQNQKKLEKEYQALVNDPNASVEDRRKAFEKMVNSASE